MLSTAARLVRTRGATFAPALRTSATLSAKKSDAPSDLASLKRFEPSEWFPEFTNPAIRGELNKLRDLEAELIATVDVKVAPIDWDAWEKQIRHPTLLKELKEIYATMPLPDVEAETAAMHAKIEETFKPIMSNLAEMAKKTEKEVEELEKRLGEVTFLEDNLKEMPIDEFLDRYPSVKKSIANDIENNKWFVQE